jgi:hypothetical protein
VKRPTEDRKGADKNGRNKKKNRTVIAVEERIENIWKRKQN